LDVAEPGRLSDRDVRALDDREREELLEAQRYAELAELPTAEEIAAGFTRAPVVDRELLRDRTRIPDRTFQPSGDPARDAARSAYVGLQNVLQNPMADFGHFIADITTYGAAALRGGFNQLQFDAPQAEYDFQTQGPEFPFSGHREAQDFTLQKVIEEGNPEGIFDYPEYQGPAKTDGNGFVLYQGKKIRQDLFLDYIYSQEQPEFQVDAEGIPTTEYWAKKIFVSGAKKTLESVIWALRMGDKNMLPLSITQAQLDLIGAGKMKEFSPEYMRDVLGYRWDAELGAWILQEETEAVSGSGGGTGYGYGGYGGGYGG
jgi:hypothetical protein